MYNGITDEMTIWNKVIMYWIIMCFMYGLGYGCTDGSEFPSNA